MPASATYFWFLIVGSIAAVGLLISGIRLCRQVEDRSEKLRNFSSVARQAKLLHVAMNWDVAQDTETQSLRRRTVTCFLAIAAICLIFMMSDWAGLFRM